VNEGGVSNPDGANCLNHQHDASDHAFDVDWPRSTVQNAGERYGMGLYMAV
jgi:hypothetical protein